jgi:hypothetical protein
VSTVYYCWVCERPLSDNTVSDTHYESERVIFFCSARHWSEYQALRGL